MGFSVPLKDACPGRDTIEKLASRPQDRLRLAEHKITLGLQGLIKCLQQALLKVARKIDHHVAAKDKVHSRRRRIREKVVALDLDHPLQGVADMDLFGPDIK